MFRRFFLAGLLSIIDPGSLVQLCVATLFCVLYLVVQLHVKPMADAMDGYLALGDSTALAVLYFCCVILKVKVLRTSLS